MTPYEPSPELTKAVLAGIMAPLPWIAGSIARAIPGKEIVVHGSLALTIPMSLRAIAMAHQAGARIALTKNGKLTEETQRSIVRRIAAWFVPSEVVDVVNALQVDITRLGQTGFSEEAWKLEEVEGEIVLVVLSTSFLKVSADTVADIFMSSFEMLKKFRESLPTFGGTR